MARKKPAAPLHVPPIACTTCPYRRDTPSGIWSPKEYASLKLYDPEGEPKLPVLVKGPDGATVEMVSNPVLATFLCHQTNATGRRTVCRGWLSTHREHVSVRLAVITGLLDVEDVPVKDESSVYYATGHEACAAGMKDIKKPGIPARLAVMRLQKTGAGQKRRGARGSPKGRPTSARSLRSSIRGRSTATR